MKKIITTTYYFLVTLQLLIAQDSLNSKTIYPQNDYKKLRIFKPADQQHYIHRWKSTRTTAITLLTVGTVAAVSGYFVFQNNNNNSDWGSYGENLDGVFIGGIVMICGGIMVVGSVPLFIVSSHYKAKAMNMSASIKMERVTELNQLGVVLKHIPALSLNINF